METETGQREHLQLHPEATARRDAMTDIDWESFRRHVQSQLADFLSGSRAAIDRPPEHGSPFWAGLQSALSGGKMTRPRLVRMAYLAHGGSDDRACAQLAASFELLHAALLIHDDVIDRDFVRRGVPTLSAVYRDHALKLGQELEDAEHAGQSAAIIAGDLLLAGSIRLSSLAAVTGPDPVGVIEAMATAVVRSASGELDDLLYSLQSNTTSVANVLDMERMKTAAYSFEAPLAAGALLAGSGTQAAAQLGAVGRRIGIAYQIIDDVLGTFGNTLVTGKPVDSDLREGKHTILSAYAATVCDFDAHVRGFRRGDLDIAGLRQLLRDCGAEEYARNLAAELVQKALVDLGSITLTDAVRADFESIAHYAINRGK
ncbi:polyprenyl synthetase family protein [Paeniglutamicibacter cryotolerans]|uniref:Geranylgeranyl diphosphate synthase type II n=1 Tax=Paeniglutamicibacter cryotolerans TaxID=670079 RepID=A0A839QFC9_9MICC|nr:polyprenyl synthetase family protein [Paeniglutamicibacter cryotolerans]MBB2994610.1 geranylgeranyl diphosphate synthase type II [Paeniglutamicibacter cryotolerans]